MSNTVTNISYANTFGEWMVATNALINENNVLAAGDYTKSSGTIYLNETTQNSLQANGTVIVQKELRVQGTGSAATIDRNLTVGGQVYFTNSSLGLTHTGQANLNGLVLVQGSGIGISVSNNAYVGGNTTIRYNTITNNLQANSTVNTATASVTGTTFTNALQANSYVNTVTASVSGTTFTNLLVANSSVSTETIQSNQSVNTSIISASNKLIAKEIEANNYIVSPTIYANTFISNTSAQLTGIVDANNASGFFNSLYVQGGGLTVNGNFVLTGSTVYASNTFLLSDGVASGIDSYYNVDRGSSGVDASFRWNETKKYWETLNVTSNTFYRLVTDEYLSQSAGSYSNSAFVAANSAGTYANSAFVKANAAYAAANSAVTTFIGTTGSFSQNSISFSSNNGVTFVVTSANNFAVSTPQDLRTTASPTFAGLSLTAPLALSQGGTGATSSGAALTSLLPTGTTAGYVLTTGGPGNFYWSASSGGGGGATPGTSINSTRLSYTANGQSGYTGNSFIIPTATTSTQVRAYINGVRQFESEYTANLSSNTITFSTTPASGDAILIEVDGYYVNPYYANNIAYTPTGTISGNTIQIAIDTLEAGKAALSGATFTGIVSGITIATGVSNTALATTAHVQNSIAPAYTQANTATTNAATADSKAVSAGSYANSAFLVANTPPAIANSAALYANGAFIQANAAFSKANSSVQTNSNTQFWSVGVGTAASTSNGEIRATGTITAGYSDDNLKTRLGNIENALDKVMLLNGFYYEPNQLAQNLGYKLKKEVGVSAQEVEKVLPEIVVPAPIDNKYLTIQYEKMVPLLIEAIKELKLEIDALKGNKQ